jgi:YD repeat-containing protein
MDRRAHLIVALHVRVAGGAMRRLTLPPTNTNGTNNTLSFTYQTYTISHGNEPMDPSAASQYLLTRVTLPTAMRYDFTYRSGSGELEQITYPTCGISRYFYQTYSVLDRPLGVNVYERMVSSHDTGVGQPTWSWTYYSITAAPQYTRIEVPGMGSVYHYMQKSSPGWAEGSVTRTTQPGSPGTESSHDWTQDDEFLASILNPRATYAEKVLKGPPDLVVRTEFTYASVGDYSGNVKETREYAFSGALRRKTLLNYLHETHGVYVPLNIIDRVSESYVYDGSNNLVAKTVTGYDESSLYGAPNAIRHDAAYGTGYLSRGLATTVTRWYDLVNNYTIATTTRYDECGNPRDLKDGRNYTTFVEYWLSPADNAYAFPLRTTNPKSQATQATYSYRSGVVLSQTDANGRTTTMTYDNWDRITGIDRPDLKAGPEKTFLYHEAWCEQQKGPSVDITVWLTDSTSRQKTEQLDILGRFIDSTVTDPGGNIKQEQTYGEWNQVSTASMPHREGAQQYWTSYGYSGSRLSSVTIPESGARSYNYTRTRRR